MRLSLYAYFALNPGDDLMVRLLLERYPQVRFFAPTWAPESEIFRQYPNFENMEALAARYGRVNHLINLLYPGDHYLQAMVKRRLRSCRGSVYVGGSVFTERTSPAGEAEKLENGPLLVLGASYARKDDAFADFFARCYGVSFREKAAAERFRGLPNVRYAPDLVLNFRPPQSRGRGRVLISVMDLTARPETAPWAAAYEAFLVKLCRSCGDAVLVSFCKKEGDEAALDRVAARAGKVEVLRYRGDLEALQAAYACADRVIATRLHAMILAFCFRRPVFALSYDKKIENVAQDMQFSAVCPISELEKLTPEEALRRCALPQALESCCRAAAGHFAAMEAFLNGLDGKA